MRAIFGWVWEQTSAHLSAEGFSCSSSTAGSFWNFVLMSIPFSINIVPTKCFQSKLTACIQRTQKSPSAQSYMSCSYCLCVGSVALHHLLQENNSDIFRSPVLKRTSNLKLMQSFPSTWAQIQGLKSYKKCCFLLLFKIIIDREGPQLLVLNVLSLHSSAYPLSSIDMT